MNKEEYYIFEPLKEFPEYYEINRYGQIRNRIKGTYLKGSKDTFGYLVVYLYIDKKTYKRAIHRLVAIQWIPNPNNYEYVNHIDENKSNPCVDNLEWVDPKTNTQYGTAMKRSSIRRGKPVDEFNVDGKYIRTWRSPKALFEYIVEEMKAEGIKYELIGHKIRGNSGDRYALMFGKVFKYSDGKKTDIKVKFKRKRGAEIFEGNISDDVIIDEKYLYNENEYDDSIMDILKEIYKMEYNNIKKRDALRYAMACIEIVNGIEKFKKECAKRIGRIK